jgi:hypothetical protein
MEVMLGFQRSRGRGAAGVYTHTEASLVPVTRICPVA